MVDELGKLKRTLSEKCPFCDRPLQVRATIRTYYSDEGEEITSENLYVRCSNLSCDYEDTNIKHRNKKDKKKEHWR